MMKQGKKTKGEASVDRTLCPITCFRIPKIEREKIAQPPYAGFPP